MNRAERRRLVRKLTKVAAGNATFTADERDRLDALVRDHWDKLPTGFRDQLDAAVNDLTTKLHTYAADTGLPTGHVRSTRLVDRLEQLRARLTTETVETCRHVRFDAPQPLSVFMWDRPLRLICGRCDPGPSNLDPVEDRTCDLCRRDTGETTDTGDGCVYAIAVQFGALLVHLGVCRDCSDQLDTATTPAVRP